MRIWFLLLFVFHLANGSLLTLQLTEQERSKLRFHLENLWNEVHLIVLNEKSETLDVKRQERELQFFQIFDRIPFSRKTETLRKELNASAQEHQIQLIALEIHPIKKDPPPIPKEVYTNTQRFHFSEDQLVEKLQILIIAKNTVAKTESWTNLWSKQLLRLVILDSLAPLNKSSNQVQILAHAFRFRQVQFPRLRPRQPVELLPAWAQKNLETFSKNEPFLWSFVTRIEEWKPKTKTAYENRRRFFLNDERMSFYLHQAKEIPPPS